MGHRFEIIHSLSKYLLTIYVVGRVLAARKKNKNKPNYECSKTNKKYVLWVCACECVCICI